MKKPYKKYYILIIITFFVIAIIIYSSLTKDDLEPNTSSKSTVSGNIAEKAPFKKRSGHTSLSFKNRLWVIGGWGGHKGLNDVWYSNNGINWKCAVKRAPFSPRALHTTVVFKNKIWVIGGLYFDREMNIQDLNDVWVSSNGKNWNQVTPNPAFTKRGGHSSVVFKNRLWVIGGVAGNADVWYTKNGRTWHQATKNAAFKSRGGQATFVFDNRMWVIGGIYIDRDNQLHSLSDVWSSENGIEWHRSAEQTEFFAGGGHSGVVFNNSMWIIGGFRRRGAVFTSIDGKNWEEVDALEDFGERVLHSCSVFKNTIWVIGGHDAARHKNDIWYIK